MAALIADHQQVRLRRPLGVEPHGIARAPHDAALPQIEKGPQQSHQEGEEVLVDVRGWRHDESPVEILPIAVLSHHPVELFFGPGLHQQEGRFEVYLHDGDFTKASSRAASSPKPEKTRTPGSRRASRSFARADTYQSTFTPTWMMRGSPAPLRTVPSKLKASSVACGRRKLSSLNRLKTSTSGCTVRPPTAKSRDSRRSSEENLLSLRPRLRRTTKSQGAVGGVPGLRVQ